MGTAMQAERQNDMSRMAQCIQAQEAGRKRIMSAHLQAGQYPCDIQMVVYHASVSTRVQIPKALQNAESQLQHQLTNLQFPFHLPSSIPPFHSIQTLPPDQIFVHPASRLHYPPSTIWYIFYGAELFFQPGLQHGLGWLVGRLPASARCQGVGAVVNMGSPIQTTVAAVATG